jgi:GNAT superfamily N-acetyltransferase
VKTLPTFVLRVADAVRWRLSRLGIHIEAFFMVREGARQSEALSLDSQFRLVTLTAADIGELMQLDKEEVRAKALRCFSEGALCFGLRDGDRLVAKMWCSLTWLYHEPMRRELRQDEAYLFSAYTDPTYRGRQLAPQLRSACYQALRNLGRTNCLSFTVYTNNASRRFKAKLGAVEESLHLYVRLFGKWSRTWLVREYR